MKRIIILCHILIGPFWLLGQSCGLEDTIIINPNATQSFQLQITDYFNDNLADPVQGVCGIELYFLHQFIDNLEISVTSPGGDVVQLIGPNTDEQFAFTFFSRWNITFLPCAETPMPDSGYVAQWSNEQPANFASGFLYDGSYHPYIGCLEDFNSGPVNGTWTFQITNNPSPYSGAVLFARLIFCDSRGVDCCFAKAGDLLQPDLLTCEGDTSLALDLPPTIIGLRPDTLEYDYTYLISQNGVLLDLDTLVDLRGYPAGTYEVCGLSYRRSESDSLPVPDNVLTLDSLRNNLDGFFADFCGNISDSCVTVTIAAPPPPTDLTIAICDGDNYSVGDSTFTESGVYAVLLEGFAGCDSLVNLNLTVVPDQTIQLTQTICRGDTVFVGASAYMNSGLYTTQLFTAIGCDSTVILDLTVLEPVVETLSVTICAGESYVSGADTFSVAGDYTLQLLAVSGCDSILELTLNVLQVEANIATAVAIDCFNNGIILDGNPSSPAVGLTYSWADLAGNPLGASPTLSVDTAGTYILNILLDQGGAQCRASDTIVVADIRVRPTADAGLPDTLTCAVLTAPVGGPNTSVGAQFSYAWETTGGSFAGLQNTRTTLVNAPGDYLLIVTNTMNSCRDSAIVTIGVDRIRPMADAGPDTSLTCTRQSVILDGSASSSGAPFVYEWRSTTNIVPANADTPAPEINIAGQYRLIVQNMLNACADTAFVLVTTDTLPPNALINPPVPERLDCTTRTLTLDASSSDSGVDFPFIWTASAGGNIAANDHTLTPLINAAGNYELMIINSRNGCRDSASVSIIDTTNIIVANISGPDTITCDAPVLSLNGSGSSIGADITYSWSSSDGVFTPGSTPDEIMASSNGLYQLVVTDTFTHCTDTTFRSIILADVPPVAQAGQGFLLDCETIQGNLDGSLSDQGNEYAYLWTGPCIQSAPDALQVVVNCPGLYQLEVRNLNTGCIATDTVRVMQSSALPNAVISTPLVLDCVNAIVTLDGSMSSPADSLAYQWFGTGLGISDTTSTITVSEPGMYTLVVSNPLTQCSDTTTVNVIENRVIPVADAGPDTTVTCSRTSVVLGGPATSSGSSIVYEWITFEGNISVPANGPTLEVDTSGDYRLYVTDTINGCADTAFVFVSRNQTPPFVNAGPMVEIDCAANAVTLNGAVTSLNPSTISWTGNCILTPPDQLSIEVDCAGDYVLTAIDETNGCMRSDTAIVEFSPFAPIAVTIDTTAISCETGVATINTSGSTTGFYQWFRNGALTAFTTLNPVVDEPGTYLLVVSNLDQSCTDSATAVVTLDCIPQAIIATPDTITCVQELVQLDGSASSAGAGAIFSYFWIEPETGCIFDGQGTTMPRVRCGGEYLLVVTNNVVQLSDTVSVFVAIDTIRPVAAAELPDTITCEFREVLLDAGNSSSGSEIAYVWTSISNDTLSQTATAVADLPGTYLLEVYDTTNGCSAVDFVQVFQSDVIPRIIFPNTIFPCLQDSFRLTSFVDPPDGSFSYAWSGAGILGNTDSAFVQISGPGIYILTVTELNGNCTTVDTAIVMEQNCVPCLALMEPASLTCTNSTAILEVSFCELCIGCTLQWTTSGSGIILSGEQTLTPTVGAAGIYTLVATDTLGFQSTLNVTVTAATNPVADAGPDRLITCDSLSVSLGSFNTPTGPDFAYQWSALGSGAPSPDNERFTMVNVPDTYVLEVLNTQTGCFATDMVFVGSNFDTPMAEAGPPAAITCNQSLVVLDGAGSTLGSNITYFWTNGSANCIQGAMTLNPIVSCPGVYRLTVRNTLSGCTATDSVIVASEGAPPILLPIPDTSLNCTRTEVRLMGNAPGLTGYTTQWCALDANSNVVPGSCVNGLELLATQPGRYRFTLQDNTTGCIATRIVTIFDGRQLPAADAGLSATLFCTQDSLVLQGIADPNLEYQWSALGVSLIANANTLSPTIYNPDTFILQVTNPLTNCVARDTVVILQDLNTPAGDAGLPDTLNCSVNAVTLNGQGSTTSGNIIWQWTTDVGNILSGAATPTPLVNRRGAYYLTVRDPLNNCTVTDTVFIEENKSRPEIDLAGFPGLQLTCLEDTITFDASNSASATGMPLSFQWDAIALGNLIGNPTAPVIQADRVGTYRLILTDVSNTCRDTLVIPLGASIADPIAVLATPLPLGCLNNQTTLNAAGSSSGPEFRYEWRDPNGQLLPETGISIQVSLAGDYTFTVINTSTGCDSEAVGTVVENRTLPQAIAEVEGLLDCETQEVMLNGSNSSSGPRYTYNWSTDLGLLLSPADAASVLAGAAGAYVLTVRDIVNGCEAKDTIVAEAVGNFIEGATLSLIPPTCDGQNGGAIIVESVQGGTGPFLFALNSTIYTATQNFRFLLPGEYLLQVQDANGCEWDTLLTMPELLPPVVDLGPDINMELGDTIRLEALVNGPYESLLWSPSSAFADPTLSVQRVSPSETMAFTVVVRDEYGCQGSDNILITVAKPIPVFIPDAFSPNGDGQNDVLLIFAGDGVRSIAVFNIFDRWGNLVFGRQQFLPNDPAFGWDGNFEGRPMNAAVYVYFAEVELGDGVVIQMKGDVILMR